MNIFKNTNKTTNLLIKRTQLLIVFVFSGVFISNATNHTEKPLVLNNDLQAINAVLLHPNGEAHFFINKYFYKYNVQYDKIKQKGVIGKDGWYKLPSNVDAALMHPNKKGYVFSGNSYYRYDFSKKKVDKQGILGADGWKGIEGPIDAAIAHPTNNCAYFFKGKKYYRFSFSKDKVDKVGTIGVDGWKGLPANLDAAIIHPNGKAYFFKGDDYYRYAFGRSVDKKGIIGRDGWKGLFHKIDAVVSNNGNIHYIKKGLYTKEDRVKKRLGYDGYKGVPSGVNAAFFHSKNGKYYFLKDEKFYRYNPSLSKVDKIGVIGKDEFPGVPKNIDAACSHGDYIRFFKGSTIYVFNIRYNRLDYKPLPITYFFKEAPSNIGAAYIYPNHGSTIALIKNDMVYSFTVASGEKKIVFKQPVLNYLK